MQATQAMNDMFPDFQEKVDPKVMAAAAEVLAPNVLPHGTGSWGHMDDFR